MDTDDTTSAAFVDAIMAEFGDGMDRAVRMSMPLDPIVFEEPEPAKVCEHCERLGLPRHAV